MDETKVVTTAREHSVNRGDFLTINGRLHRAGDVTETTFDVRLARWYERLYLWLKAKLPRRFHGSPMEIWKSRRAEVGRR